ncbi:MAG: AI-2E family transporter [Propionibacteriaceae bacterium]|nr:AI-2E family transporter [Propionibacteriaceae bacterium]
MSDESAVPPAQAVANSAPGASAVPAVAPAGVSAADGAKETATNTGAWMRRWRRITQPTPPDPEGRKPAKQEGISLLNRNPFQIGFYMAFGAIIAWGLVNALMQIQGVLVLMALAFMIALGMNRLVEVFHRRGLRRGLCVLIVVAIVLVVLALAVWAVVPTVSEQITLLFNNAPSFITNLRNNPQIADLDDQFKFVDSLATFFADPEKLISTLSGGLAGAGAAVAAVASTVFNLIITIVLTIYFLIALPSLKEVIYRLAPASKRSRVRYLASEMMNRVGGYISGLVLQVLIATTVVFGYLWIIDLGKYSYALAVMTALAWFIPIVGSTIAIIAISVVAFSSSPVLGLVTLCLFLVYQEFDAYFISPRIMSKSVKVPGIMVILGAISGAYLLGMMGAILAVPTVAALMLLYQEVLIPHLDRK